jgi:tetratricopeptide (TPR) repeat protein
MSMNAIFSPMPSFKLSQPGALKPGRLFAPYFVPGLLFAGLLFANPLFAGPLRAEVRTAEIASSDRALGADLAAYHALQEGRGGDAANLLRATLAANPGDALAHQLLCRLFYAEDEADDAIRQCELAVSTAPATGELASDNNLWLGRAYGMKARHAGPIAGFTLARKVEASFSRAVELNPASVAALSDLGEYYVAAPFIMGGGANRAHALAARMMPRFPGAAHRLLARLADSDNNLAAAESEFKQAVAAQRSPEAWIDLAQFYQTRARPDDALAAVKSALAADRAHGPALVDAASILTKANRAPDLAERCLRDYLASRAKSDAAPAFKVHLQLSRLLAARGDAAGADREAAAAAALAPAFTRSSRTSRGR